MTAKDYIKIAAMALTETESTFSKSDILKTAGKFSIGEVRVSELEHAFTALMESKSLIQLDGKEKGYKGTYTTREMLKIENELISMIKNGVGKAEALMPATEAEKAITGYIEKQREHDPDFKLTGSQHTAIRDLLSSTSQYQILQGSAGTGKSTAFSVLSKVLSIYSEKDIELQGLSFTGKAAGELQKSSGIESMTLAKFLMDTKNTEGGNHNQPQQEDIPRRERLQIVDEASMLSSRDAHRLFMKAQKENSKIVLVGDVKQLLSVNSGRLFSDVQSKSVIDVTEMTEVLRQQTEHMKQLVADVSEKKVDAAFDKLERHGKLVEIPDRAELIQAITQEFSGNDNWQNTLVLTGTNEARRELNQSIRVALQAEGKIDSEDVTLTVRIPKNISATDKHFAQSYQTGDRIFASGGGGLRAGSEATVIGVDQERHHLIMEDNKGNVKFYDLKEHGGKISAYTEEQKEFATGEKIIFTKNDNKLGFQNGLSGTIEKVDEEGNLRVRTENGEQVAFSTKNYGYFDHGAAISVYKSQGMTSDNVIIHVDSGNPNMNTLNSLYTSISRARHGEGKILFTDDAAIIREQMKEEAVKTSTLDYDRKLGELDAHDKHQGEKELSLDAGKVGDGTHDLKLEHDEESKAAVRLEHQEEKSFDDHEKGYELSH